METLRGRQFTMSDGTMLVTEVVSDEDSHLCLYVLLQDMLKAGDMIVGFEMEWGFKGCSSSSSSSSSRSASNSGRLAEHHHSQQQSEKSERHSSRKVGQHHIAVLTFCTKLGCVLIRLSPNSISASLKRFLTTKDIMFVGVHIGEDLQKLRQVHGLVVRNAVELSDLAAKVHEQPRLVAYNARELAGKVSSVKFEQKPFTVLWSNWFEPTLTSEQIESATVDAYASYKIGKKLMDSGCGSSVKRLFS